MNFILKYIDKGYLVVNAYMARDAIPVEGVLVRVMGAEEMNRGESRSEITDEDGVTPPITLSAPIDGYSLSPDPKEQPYAVYDVTLMKPGFYTKHIYNVAVFAGITTVLPVNMVLSCDGEARPIGGLDIYSYENPSLE